MTYGGSLFAAYYAQRASRLPAGYREVEYLESTGNQWIDTGIYVNQDTDVEIDYCNTVGSNAFSVFGCKSLMNFTGNKTEVIFRYNSTNHTASLQLERAKRRMNGNVASVNGEIVHTFDKAIFAASYTALLFARSNNLTGAVEEKTKSKVWSCRIDNVRSFVPCVRVADGKPGMYDLCGSICPLTGTPFYVNSGTGNDFTWGELS